MDIEHCKVMASKTFHIFIRIIPCFLNAALPHFTSVGENCTQTSAEGFISQVLYQSRQQNYSKTWVQPQSKSTHVCVHFKFQQSFSHPPSPCFRFRFQAHQDGISVCQHSQFSKSAFCLHQCIRRSHIRGSVMFIIWCHGTFRASSL